MGQTIVGLLLRVDAVPVVDLESDAGAPGAVLVLVRRQPPQGAVDRLGRRRRVQGTLARPEFLLRLHAPKQHRKAKENQGCESELHLCLIKYTHVRWTG